MQFSYRPDIQGLRAIAVLLVFFSHAKSSLFGGGFIGVDVFFVISGYVITELLLKDYHQRGAIILHRFYARRLQRLLPALAFMLLVTVLISFFILTPSEQEYQYGTGISADYWMSNLFLLFSKVGYFQREAATNIFLHTWSLGVEEQFYLIWPFLILLGLGHFSGKDNGKTRLVPMLILTFIVSLLLSFWASQFSPKQAFYQMPARAWQFALGGLIAHRHVLRSHERLLDLSTVSINIVAATGLSLILGAAFWFDRLTPYPNWQVLVPTIGSALLLLAWRQDNESMIGKLLSTKPLRWLGDISYSFYLWHWPVLFLTERIIALHTGWSVSLSLGATLMTASLSYYLVENPVRHNNRLIARPRQVILGALSMMVMVSALLAASSIYSGKLGSDPEYRKIVEARYQTPVVYKYGCDDWYRSAQVQPCVFGNPKASRKIVMIGDSILMQWFPAIAAYYVKNNWQLIVLTKSSCPMVNRSYYYENIRSYYTVCDLWRQQAIKFIRQIKPDVLIMGSASTYPFSREQWQQGTSEIVEQLLPAAGRIKLIAATPVLTINGQLCLERNYWYAKTMPGIPKQNCSNELHPSATWSWIREAVSGHSHVKFIELSKAICPGGVCSASNQGMIVYRDSLHLTEGFVLTIRSQLIAQLSKN